MLEESRIRLLDSLAADDLVLDVGGWGKPLPRADWVLDLQPYETRGLYGYEDVSPDEERFSDSTWVVRDICSREPWPFADDEFDFAVCSHTLEDIRDPIWVCSELGRVAKAGYVEVPSRLEEQAHGIQGNWVGWDHHRWLCDLAGEALEFVFKAHYIHAHPSCQIRAEFALGQPLEARRLQLWWLGTLEAQERVMTSTEDLHAYLESYADPFPSPPGRLKRIVGRAGP